MKYIARPSEGFTRQWEVVALDKFGGVDECIAETFGKQAESVAVNLAATLNALIPA